MARPLPVRIGRYEVIQVLGQGGMGTVFLAQDPRLKRRVAIKVVRDPGGDAQERVLERFQREAEISAQLNHPNVITVYDVGEDPEAGPFLAMEFVDGQSLAFLIRERRPGIEVGLVLLLQAMRGLQAAHDAGIIHRDVKPENMLVSEDGRLKLMDFGLAKGDHARLTATGSVMGTPAFTAPELMLGAEPSQTTDRYAFYVTAFELLTGALPYKADSIGSTLYRIVHDPPTLPPDLTQPLRDLFTRALAKEPAARPATLQAFLGELIQGIDLPEAVQRKLSSYLDLEGLARPVPSPPPGPVEDASPTLAVSPRRATPPKGARLPGLPSPRVALPTPPPKPVAPRRPLFPKAGPPPMPQRPSPAPRPSAPPKPAVTERWETPFDGVDWEAVLAAPPAGLDDLEASLAGVDVLQAASHVEAEADLAQLEADLGELDGGRVLAAEEHAEAEDATADLEHLLQALSAPEVLAAEDRAEREEARRR